MKEISYLFGNPSEDGYTGFYVNKLKEIVNNNIKTGYSICDLTCSYKINDVKADCLIDSHRNKIGLIIGSRRKEIYTLDCKKMGFVIVNNRILYYKENSELKNNLYFLKKL